METVFAAETVRPYRSHLRFACSACRKRKSRCSLTSTASSCLMCVAHGTKCTVPGLQHNANAGLKRKRSSPIAHVADGPERAHNDRRVTSQKKMPALRGTEHITPSEDFNNRHSLADILTETHDGSSHVISPAVVHDSDIVANYLSAKIDTAEPMARKRKMLGSYGRPLLFSKVKTQPLGAGTSQSLAASKREIIENCVGPWTTELVSLFFEHANICFPVFDEASFRQVYSSQKDTISSALLCNLYAYSIVYWKKSTKLRSQKTPNSRFVWTQANEALHSELFICPGISTILALILNVCGRPSTCMFGNGGMIGATVALANAVGLNRDPSNWEMSEFEKRFRIKCWWLIVLNDRWYSLAYGTPLQIHAAQFDVPIPCIEDICTEALASPKTLSASIFIALLTLTEDVLSRCLEYIYTVSKSSFLSRDASPPDLEAHLVSWRDGLAEDIKQIVSGEAHMDAPGAANLQLSYYAVKLLIRRIHLDLAPNSREREDSGGMLHSYILAQQTAGETVRIVQALDKQQLGGFWIPANEFTLTSTTMLLLRCGIKLKDVASFRVAKEMMDTLRLFQDKYDWDLANGCLESCSQIVEKVSEFENNSNEACLLFDPQCDLKLDKILEDIISSMPDFAGF